MLVERDICEGIRNKHGDGMGHKYEVNATNGDKVVMDRTADLIWQQGGSKKEMTFEEAEDYIRDLNKVKYGGYDNWRLPSLEEAMSLMKPSDKNSKIHVECMFDQSQRVIWTADKISVSHAWVVDFLHGGCEGYGANDTSFVRAVR
jgi:hypothetical protein